MEEDIYKIVEFGEYCKKCYFWDRQSFEEPCNECLDNPVNLYSHKPVKYSEIGSKKNKD